MTNTIPFNPIKRLPISHTLPLEVGMIHLVGIGGIGMSSIAEILHNLGYKVQGSDMTQNANVDRLRKMGINVIVGQKAENVSDVSVVVKSTAVKMNNPEIVEARKHRIPVVRRSDMLAELVRLKMSIAVAGTHGKTTTTSLTAALLEAAEFNPTVINGGIINAYGTNARLGKGKWLVVEADESDGTFIKLPATIGIITNIDPEHLDHYGSFDGLRAAFEQFIDNLPFYGFAVLCIDHPEVQSLVAKITDRRIITYGVSPQADIRIINHHADVMGQYCDVECTDPISEEIEIIEKLHLPMHGHHNLLNAMASLAVARELGIDNKTILQGFNSFGGVKRRFTKTGEVAGISIIDDYGHHPVEIAATLGSARQARRDENSKVIAVVQPHRYTRLRDLFNDFCTCLNDADIVIIANVFEAGEQPIEGYNRDTLVEGIRNHGHKNVIALENESELATQISELATDGDLVVCLGAGNISAWANALPEQLEELLIHKNTSSITA